VDWNIVDLKTLVEPEVNPLAEDMTPKYYQEFFKTRMFSPMYGSNYALNKVT